MTTTEALKIINRWQRNTGFVLRLVPHFLGARWMVKCGVAGATGRTPSEALVKLARRIKR